MKWLRLSQQASRRPVKLTDTNPITVGNKELNSFQIQNPSYRVLNNLSLKSQQVFAKDNSDGTKSSQQF